MAHYHPLITPFCKEKGERRKVKGERAQAVIKKHRDELYQITVQRYIFFLKQQSSFFVIF